MPTTRISDILPARTIAEHITDELELGQVMSADNLTAAIQRKTPQRAADPNGPFQRVPTREAVARELRRLVRKGELTSHPCYDFGNSPKLYRIERRRQP